MTVFVTTAAQSAARDAAAISAGTPSSTLMSSAADAALDALKRHAGSRLERGIAVFAGTGNNGGDAWVMAGRLREQGFTVRVHATGDPTTTDAKNARANALAGGPFDPPRANETAVIDGLLGTGARGPLREEIVKALFTLAELRARGAFVLALDVPSGLDATTGVVALETVPADVTVTFGTMKRGLVIGRDAAGVIEVADIGLGAHAVRDDGAPQLMVPATVRASVPRINAGAHKGTRGRIAIVGGNVGMAGATILCARGALRSGAGLVRVVVAPGSLAAVQAAVPEATGATWPVQDANVIDELGFPDAMVVGPGLGIAQRALVEMVVRGHATPCVLDADALIAFAGDARGLGDVIGERTAVITPHPAECGRLLGLRTSDVLANRFDIGRELAFVTHAVVVLKGTPTVVTSPDGRVIVAPVGSPVLATGGSGDVLSGVIGTLLATMPDPFDAALAGVWAHGTAAEMVATTHVRGASLADVVEALRTAWSSDVARLPAGILAVCAAVGER